MSVRWDIIHLERLLTSEPASLLVSFIDGYARSVFGGCLEFLPVEFNCVGWGLRKTVQVYMSPVLLLLMLGSLDLLHND